MKTNKIKRIIITISIVVIYFLIYKEIMLINYTQKPDITSYANGILENYKNPQTINITSINSEKYIEHKGIKVKDVFSKYEKIESDDSSVQYGLYENGYLKRLFTMGDALTYIDIYANGYDKYNTNVSSTSVGKTVLYNKEKTYNYLKGNKVLNDNELFNFIIKNFDNKSNILTSTSKMKENMYVKEFVLNIMPRVKDYHILSGDINGFMFELINGGYEIHIGEYALVITGFTKEEVIELVRTIKINEEK